MAAAEGKAPRVRAKLGTFSWKACILAANAGLVLSLGLGGCASLKNPEMLAAAKQQQLSSSINVASAAAEAGQFEAAARLYGELYRHYPDAPEPRLGLGYLALRNGDFPRAGELFAEAEERSATGASKAAALLGAGRAELGQGNVAVAKGHFLAASELATNTPAEPWVVNGLGVVATLEGDHARARQHYDEAVKLSSHPMITANLVRSMAQSGDRDEARRLYAKYSASHWLDSDATELSRLMEEGSRPEQAPAPVAASAPPEVTPQVIDSTPAGVSEPAAAPELVAAPEPAATSEPVATPEPAVASEPVATTPEPAATPEPMATSEPVETASTPATSGTAEADTAPAVASNSETTPEPAATSEPVETASAPATSGTAEAAAAPAVTSNSETAPEPAAASVAAGVQVQIYAARSEAGALAAWGRLSAEQKDLLDSLTPSVVKAELGEKGIFYRLRAGPLADKDAAGRLCRLLKGRGHGCFVPVPREDSAASAGESASAPANALAGAVLVQLFAARSEDGALAAWGRLSAAEENLLGALAPRVVKAQIPEKGVFYRLFAGPLPDAAGAQRLCETLKDRGRECFVRR